MTVITTTDGDIIKHVDPQNINMATQTLTVTVDTLENPVSIGTLQLRDQTSILEVSADSGSTWSPVTVTPVIRYLIVPGFYDSALDIFANTVDAAIRDSAIPAHTLTNTNVTRSLEQAILGTYSLKFDGTASLVATADTKFNLGTDDFTLSLRIKLTVNEGGIGYALLNCGDLTQDAGAWFLGVMSDHGALIFSYRTDGGVISTTFGTDTATPGDWHLITVVRDGTTVTLYRDGVVAADSITGVSTSFSQHDIQIGNAITFSVNPSPYVGYLDDLLLLPGVTLWTAAFTPPAANMRMQEAMSPQGELFYTQTTPPVLYLRTADNSLYTITITSV